MNWTLIGYGVVAGVIGALIATSDQEGHAKFTLFALLFGVYVFLTGATSEAPTVTADPSREIPEFFRNVIAGIKDPAFWFGLIGMVPAWAITVGARHKLDEKWGSGPKP